MSVLKVKKYNHVKTVLLKHFWLTVNISDEKIVCDALKNWKISLSFANDVNPIYGMFFNNCYVQHKFPPNFNGNR